MVTKIEISAKLRGVRSMRGVVIAAPISLALWLGLVAIAQLVF